jgi:hypothetical protein
MSGGCLRPAALTTAASRWPFSRWSYLTCRIGHVVPIWQPRWTTTRTCAMRIVRSAWLTGRRACECSRCLGAGWWVCEAAEHLSVSFVSRWGHQKHRSRVRLLHRRSPAQLSLRRRGCLRQLQSLNLPRKPQPCRCAEAFSGRRIFLASAGSAVHRWTCMGHISPEGECLIVSDGLALDQLAPQLAALMRSTPRTRPSQLHQCPRPIGYGSPHLAFRTGQLDLIR